ncbi:hypothetical protein CRYUN_Cryun09bG0048600 [Craigia yunnanensis]
MEPLFRFVLDAFCRARKLNDVVFAFETKKKLIGKPRVVIYNVLINGFLKSGDFDKALGNGKFESGLELFREMKEKSCSPNVEGQLLEACDLVIDFSRRGLLPKGFDYCGLVEELCGEGNAGRAFEGVNQLWMKGNVPSLIACTTLIEGLRRAERREDAFGLMENLLKDGIVPDL